MVATIAVDALGGVGGNGGDTITPSSVLPNLNGNLGDFGDAPLAAGDPTKKIPSSSSPFFSSIPIVSACFFSATAVNCVRRPCSRSFIFFASTSLRSMCSSSFNAPSDDPRRLATKKASLLLMFVAFDVDFETTSSSSSFS